MEELVTEAAVPTTFDVVILGAGSGGYAAALRASELNLSVALVEKDKLGGTCLHRGCIPTKALLHAGEVADSARESAQFGVEASLNGINMGGVNSYKDGVVNRLYKGLQGLVRSRGVTFVEGSGRLVGPKSVDVNGVVYTANKAVILATGSYARSLPGLEIGGRIITSEQGLQLDWVPKKAIVLGGGVIGVEFASAWRSFGADVVIVEALDRLLPLDDEASSKALERAYRRRGIEFRTGVRFSGATQHESGVQVTLEDGTVIDADLLLVAVGRGPNSQGLGFEEQGIAYQGPFVAVDERFRTNVAGIYAVGDLTPAPQLAHAGFQEGIFVAEDIAGLNPAPIDLAGIPRVTYSEPEVASVGLTQVQAEEKYGADGIDTFTYDLAGNGKSQILKTAGFVKLIRAKNGPVVGVHMVGSRVGELLAEAQLIYGWEATPEDVAPLIHAHPTMSEAVGEAHLALAGKPLHVHG
jgi:dihydrolipoamide dehydrogenase